MSWKNISISDLGRVVTGDTPPRKKPEYYGDAYPFIKPTDMIIGHRFTKKHEEGYSQEGFEKYERKLIPAGSTAVVTIGSIGQKLTLTHTDCFVNQAINAVIPDNTRFDSLFVYYLLRYNLHLVKQADTGASSGRENVSKSNFSALRIEAPVDLCEQKSIARVLCGYDDLTENNQRRIQLLEESVRLLYREWFVRLRFPGHDTVPVTDGVPDGWFTCKLSEVADVNSSSITVKDHPESIRYVDISSVETGEIAALDEITFEEAPGRARRRVKHGDIIWSCVRPNRRSYALICNPEDNIIVSTGFAILSAHTVPFSYLYLASTTDDFVSYLTNQASGAAYPAVTAKDFEKASVLLPDTRTLAAFDNIVLPMLEQIDAIKCQNKILREARDMLLPKLMSGALDASRIVIPKEVEV